MKAFVAYEKSGRVTAIDIPNPEFGDNVVMETPEGGFVVAVDIGQVVKGAERLSFPTGAQKDDSLREILRTIVEKYRVDPATQRLLPKAGQAGAS
jgi:hypothetical protein